MSSFTTPAIASIADPAFSVSRDSDSALNHGGPASARAAALNPNASEFKPDCGPKPGSRGALLAPDESHQRTSGAPGSRQHRGKKNYSKGGHGSKSKGALSQSLRASKADQDRLEYDPRAEANLSLARSPNLNARGFVPANHLLNFQYSARGWSDASGRHISHNHRPRRAAPRPLKYDRTKFVQANFRFLVSDAVDTSEYLADADRMFDWEDIIQVEMLTSTPVQCPISLERPPICPQITPCGHIFSFSAIMHHLMNRGGEQLRSAGPCPLCFQPIVARELRYVVVRQVSAPCVGERMDFVALKRPIGSIIPYKAHNGGSVGQTGPTGSCPRGPRAALAKEARQVTAVVAATEPLDASAPAQDLFASNRFAKFLTAGSSVELWRLAAQELAHQAAKVMNEGGLEAEYEAPYIYAAMEQLGVRARNWEVRRAEQMESKGVLGAEEKSAADTLKQGLAVETAVKEVFTAAVAEACKSLDSQALRAAHEADFPSLAAAAPSAQPHPSPTLAPNPLGVPPSPASNPSTPAPGPTPALPTPINIGKKPNLSPWSTMDEPSIKSANTAKTEREKSWCPTSRSELEPFTNLTGTDPDNINPVATNPVATDPGTPKLSTPPKVSFQASGRAWRSREGPVAGEDGMDPLLQLPGSEDPLLGMVAGADSSADAEFQFQAAFSDEEEEDRTETPQPASTSGSSFMGKSSSLKTPANALRGAGLCASPPADGQDLLSHSPGSSPFNQTDPDDQYYMYQAADGQWLFLHPTNLKILLHHFGGYSGCPPCISGAVLEIEDMVQLEATRRRWKFLSHLPLTGVFRFLEVDLSDSLPPEAFAPFQEELRMRERRRKRRADLDKKRAEKEAALAASLALARKGPTAAELKSMPLPSASLSIGEEELSAEQLAEGLALQESLDAAPSLGSSPQGGVSFAHITKMGYVARGPVLGSSPPNAWNVGLKGAWANKGTGAKNAVLSTSADSTTASSIRPKPSGTAFLANLLCRSPRDALGPPPSETAAWSPAVTSAGGDSTNNGPGKLSLGSAKKGKKVVLFSTASHHH